MSSWRHYERAFDHYLRARGVSYVCVDQARQLLGPPPRESRTSQATPDPDRPLKFFDFVVYDIARGPRHALVELKGRRVSVGGQRPSNGVPRTCTRLESWATLDDLASLRTWERLFGPPFEAWIVFAYWCEDQPPDPLFQEVFEMEGRWYALRGVRIADYQQAMKTRSARWRTVDIPAAEFERISQPFVPRGPTDPPPEGPIPSAPGVSEAPRDPTVASPTVLRVTRSIRELSRPAQDLPQVDAVLRAARVPLPLAR